MDPQDLSRLADSVAGHQAWEAALMFDLSDLGDGSAMSNLMLAVPPNNHNKFEFKFPASRYPPTWETKGELAKDLQRAANQNGQQIVNQTFYAKNCHPSFSMCCARHRLYEPHSKLRRKGSDLESTTRTDTSYKEGIKATFSQNSKRLGSRGMQGPKLPRKTSTVKPISTTEKCPFIFYVRLDPGNFWYIRGPTGNCRHQFHPQLLPQEVPLRSRLMNDSDANSVAELLDHSTGSGSAISIISERTGQIISRHQCYMLHSKLRGNKEDVGLTSAEGLLHYLDSLENVSVIVEAEEAAIAAAAASKETAIAEEGSGIGRSGIHRSRGRSIQ